METNKQYFNSLMGAGEFFGKLMQSRDIAHLCHLSTNSFSEHMALGDYYSGIIDLTDELIEMCQGTHGITRFSIPSSSAVPAVPHLKELALYITNQKGVYFKESHLLNQIDEILGLIYTTIYKLENLK